MQILPNDHKQSSLSTYYTLTALYFQISNEGCRGKNALKSMDIINSHKYQYYLLNERLFDTFYDQAKKVDLQRGDLEPT